MIALAILAVIVAGIWGALMALALVAALIAIPAGVVRRALARRARKRQMDREIAAASLTDEEVAEWLAR